jgi:hypothetical protein
VYDVNKRTAALVGPTWWKRDRGCTVGASAGITASHTPIFNRCFDTASRRLPGQRRSIAISGLRASRASNVADTFCSFRSRHNLLFERRQVLRRRITWFSAITVAPLQRLFRFFSAAFPDSLTSTIVSSLTVFGRLSPASLQRLASIAF